MATFYAQYPATGVGSTTVQTVQGEGTPGSQTGGVLTVQGDPAGTPIPISGSITATNASVAPTGGAVPADITYMGMNVSGNATGLTGTSNGLNTVINAAIPAGSAIIGKVGIDQTTPGNTNGVQVNAALPAGSAIIGKVGIDQTTPGTTNGVQVNAALPAGGNTIGAVTQASGPWTITGSGTAGTAASGVVTVQGIASMTPIKVDGSGVTGPVNVTQFGSNNVVTGTGASGSGIPRVTVSNDSNVLATQSGTWNIGTVTTVSTVTAVTAISNALPAGTNLLGKVGIDQTTPGTTNGVQVNAALPAGTNLLGKVGIDQTTPGTTNAIQATSGTTVAWQAEGNIAYGSLTTSYQTVFTPSANTKILFMRNNMNQPVIVSMDAGTTQNFILDAGDQVAIDFVANGVISTTTAIQAKYSGSAPTSGSFRINGGH
jgi:hypothetical protein